MPSERATWSARGYRALKFDPFGIAWKDLTREEAEAAVDIVAAVREAVGPRVDLMIEFHGRLSAGSAIAMIRRLEPFDPAWCEEPVAPECLDLLAEVKRSVHAPIAAGERLYTQADFYRLTALRAVDVVQMDLAHCGGISAGKKIAAMAAAQDLRVAPHCSIGPVALAACLHFDVSTPNFMVQEAFAEFDVPWRSALVRGWNPIEDGEFVVPEEPGLGLELDEAAIAEHPFVANAFPSLWDARLADELHPAQAVQDHSSETVSDRSSRVIFSMTRAASLTATSAWLRLDNQSHVQPSLPARPGSAQGRSGLLVQALLAGSEARAHRGLDGLVVLRPWVKRSTFAGGQTTSW